MATNNIPIVSIFNERGSAERAIEDLYNAGISSDQISYSGGGTSATSGGGFLESIKSLFTGGHDRTSADVLNDLNNMGIPQDEAAYYAQQYDAGRTIVAIQQENLNQNALTILRSNGGYDYQGNWNRTSSDKFTPTTSDMTPSNNTYGAQNFNQEPAATSDQTDTYNNQVSDTTMSSGRNFAGTEAGSYNQASTTPTFTSQRRYAETDNTTSMNNQPLTDSDTANSQNPSASTTFYNQDSYPSDNVGRQDYAGVTDIANTPTNTNQQTYTDPNQQGFNNPNNIGQQAYINPVTYQDTNNPNVANTQTYTDATQSASAYNQGINAPQNQSEHSNAQRNRSERDEVNRTPDQNYEREMHNPTDQNNG